MFVETNNFQINKLFHSFFTEIRQTLKTSIKFWREAFRVKAVSAIVNESLSAAGKCQEYISS